MNVIAEIQGMESRSLERWWARQDAPPEPGRRRPGRPKVISSDVAWKLRQQYLASYGEWGPQVLAHWAERQGLGSHSPTTIAAVIEDLREEPEPEPTPLRYEVAAPGVMWSEDGAGFLDSGRKRELLLVQDECARFKTGHDLCPGPATGADVRRVLEKAFAEHGAPLVLKRDGGSIFDEQSVRDLLDEHGVVALTSPPATPRYKGDAAYCSSSVRSVTNRLLGSLRRAVSSAGLVPGEADRDQDLRTRSFLAHRLRVRPGGRQPSSV